MASPDRHYTERFLKRILRLEQQMKDRSPQLQNSSVEDGSLYFNDSSTGDQTAIGFGDVTVNGDSIIPKFYDDEHLITAVGDQNFVLTNVPAKHSEHLYWGGAYLERSEFTRADGSRLLVIPDPDGRFKVGRKLYCEYAYYVPGSEETVTIDIPGYVYAYNHAGSPGGIVGDGVTTSDDSSYIWFGNPGGGNATYGWSLDVKFPAVPLPGELVSTSLVVRSQGPDSRTISAPYYAAHPDLAPASPIQQSPFATMTKRDPALYHTGPDYGYQQQGYWYPVLTEGVDYTDWVTPLKWPAPPDPPGGTLYLPSSTDPEFVTQEEIESGHVEYNPGSGFSFVGSYQGETGATTVAGPDFRISYVALRVTYKIPPVS